MIKYLTKTSLRRIPVVFIASLLILVGANPTISVHSQTRNLNSLATTVSQPLDAPIIRSFVYVIANQDGPNSIAAYRRDQESGELSFITTYPTGGRGTGRFVDSQSPLLANAEETLLYAINPASNDISVMAIRQDGSLELVGTPVPSRGIAPASRDRGRNGHSQIL